MHAVSVSPNRQVRGCGLTPSKIGKQRYWVPGDKSVKCAELDQSRRSSNCRATCPHGLAPACSIDLLKTAVFLTIYFPTMIMTMAWGMGGGNQELHTYPGDCTR
ncbi:hypothetical protein FA15DRAFT_655643 [Coprinopsis marcescibilis]|uniref:Uncharacterized protein n=1 Tax=Coprinopsis marcescibilis TaxID=230819 RepID=A0A5C3KVS4_COPMA|nr:hypothetical protein FA15DRAFT_655643 [Coprinopsis marcescibilis]